MTDTVYIIFFFPRGNRVGLLQTRLFKILRRSERGKQPDTKGVIVAEQSSELQRGDGDNEDDQFTGHG